MTTPDAIPDAIPDAMPAVRALHARGVIAALVAAVDRTGGRVAVVGIDGRSGSGKTTLAADLARDLAEEGEPVTVLAMDDVYPGWDGLEEACRRLVRHVLAPLRAGEGPRVHRWDWARDRHAGWQELDVRSGGVFVVEGVGACCRAARPLLDVTVWVDAPDTVRWRRAIGRDGDTFAPHWERWAAQERRYLGTDRPHRGVHVVVDGTPASDRRHPSGG